MAFIDWDETFSVGVASIDEQHKRMVDIVIALYNSIIPGMSDATFAGLFDSLVDCAETHFKHEESFFERTDYSRAEQHRQKHNALKEQIAFWREDVINRGDPEKSRTMMEFLKSWLVDHVKDEDKKLGAHLNAKGIH
jgi:hemerythrin